MTSAERSHPEPAPDPPSVRNILPVGELDAAIGPSAWGQWLREIVLTDR